MTDGMAALFVKNFAFLPKPYTVEQLGTMLGLKFNFRSSTGPHAGDGDGTNRFTPVNIRIADPIPVFQRSLLTGRHSSANGGPFFRAAARSRPRPLMTPSGHAAKTCDPTGYVR